MLEVQKYFREHGPNALQENFDISTTVSPCGKLGILNYGLKSPKTHQYTLEARSLVLEMSTGNIVAKTFNRFFNFHECLEIHKNFNWNNFIVEEKCDGCFLFGTRVNLYKGGYLTIGEIVKNKLDVELIGVDENGNVVPCKIKNYFKNRKKENWLRIETIDDSNYENHIVCTYNHHIFINDSFKAAIEAKTGDSLTEVIDTPDDNVIHLIKSGLLGDGFLGKNGKTYYYREGHKESHNEYNNKIKLWLGEAFATEYDRISGYGSRMKDINSKNFRDLKNVYDLFYHKGKKIIPKDLSWIDDFTLAKWYMDDGSLCHNESQKDRASLSTHCFEKEDLERLILFLKNKYNLDCSINYNKGFFIKINKGKNNSIENFWKAIKNYIIPCMKYKLPLEHRDCEYIEYNSGKIVKTTKKVNITDIKIIPNKKENFPHGKTGFDLETTTNNYFVRNTLVHNSLAYTYYYDGSWRVNTRNSFAQGLIDGYNGTWQQLFLEAGGYKVFEYLNRLNPKDFAFIFELGSLFNKVVKEHRNPTLFLLSVVNNLTLKEPFDYLKLNSLAALMGVKRPQVYLFNTLDDILATVDTLPPTDEGYVANDGNMRIKFKNKGYLALHALKGNNNLFLVKYLVPLFFTKEADKDEVLTYYPEVTEKLRQIETYCIKLKQTVAELWEENKHLKDRKEFALKVKDSPYCSFLFNLYKGQPLDSVICSGQAEDWVIEYLKRKGIT